MATRPKLMQMVNDLELLQPDEQGPGCPGHHLEASERGWTENMRNENVLSIGRDELAREFEHFNTRFRGRTPFQPNNVRKVGQIRFGHCVRQSTDSSLYYCVVERASPAMGRMYLTEWGTRQVWHEVAIWSQLNHPQIVRMLGVGWINDRPCVLSEYHDEGSLYEANRRHLRLLTNSPSDIISTSSAMKAASSHPMAQGAASGEAKGGMARPEMLLIEWCRNIASAVAYLHTLTPVPILHRNIKSSNCLLSAGGTKLSLTDFNTACPLNADMTPAIGSVRWMAPELVKDEVYSERSDCYAFAMLCFEMVTCQVPFEESSIQQAAFKVANGGRPTLPSSCPQWLFELITACWQTKPSSRPTFTQISANLDSLAVTLSLLAVQQQRQHMTTHTMPLSHEAFVRRPQHASNLTSNAVGALRV